MGTTGVCRHCNFDKVERVLYNADYTVKRRNFLAALGGGAAWAHWLEPAWLKLTTVVCPVAGLGSTRPIRLVHVSDLHASTVVPNRIIESAIDMAVAQQPDLICVTGDLVTHSNDYDPVWYRAALARLPLVAPTFATMGNHDGGQWSIRRGARFASGEVQNLVRSAGLRVLHNESTEHQMEGQRLEIVGLGDLWANEIHPQQAFQRDIGLPRIVLSHNPDTKGMLAPWRWDVMLSGHTHGGQVVIPLVGSPWAPVADHRYLEGLKTWNGRWIHVSRGVGNAGGLRFNCRPEVSLLLLEGTTSRTPTPTTTRREHRVEPAARPACPSLRDRCPEPGDKIPG